MGGGALAVKPYGAVLLFAQCPFDKALGASNLAMLRYEWVWYKERGTGFLNANRAPLKKSENILVFYQSPHSTTRNSPMGSRIAGCTPAAVPAPTTGNLSARVRSPAMGGAIRGMCCLCLR